MKNKAIIGFFMSMACISNALSTESQKLQESKDRLIEITQEVRGKQIGLAIGSAACILASGYCMLNTMKNDSLEGRKLYQNMIKQFASTASTVAGVVGLAAATDSMIATSKKKSCPQTTLEESNNHAWREKNSLNQAACFIGGDVTMIASAGWFLHTLLDENLGVGLVPHLIVATGTGTLGGIAILGAILQQCTNDRW